VQIHVLAVMLKWKTAEHKEMFKKVWGGLAQIVYTTEQDCLSVSRRPHPCIPARAQVV